MKSTAYLRKIRLVVMTEAVAETIFVRTGGNSEEWWDGGGRRNGPGQRVTSGSALDPVPHALFPSAPSLQQFLADCAGGRLVRGFQVVGPASSMLGRLADTV
jgi:hypothetical protein